MRVINIGSLNVDHVYQVDHFARPGESLIARGYARFAGGKGANQSLAIARAGAGVTHVGKIGREGEWMIARMREDGVDVSRIVVSDAPGGHAMIQVDGGGQNSIVVFGGTNQQIEPAEVDAALAAAGPEDIVALQNETNVTGYAIRRASERALRVCLNAAPFTDAVRSYPLERVSLFFINEVEGKELTGESDPEAIVSAMIAKYPSADVVLTLGRDGAVWGSGALRERVPALQVKVVDTTGAGDTFIGYALAGICRGMPIRRALETATRAAAICVSRAGAAASIPYGRELKAGGHS
jgi:ribokinase